MLCETQRRDGRLAICQRKTPTGFYEIISSPDGTYRIARNGEVINVLQWSSEQLQDCERFLDELVRPESLT